MDIIIKLTMILVMLYLCVFIIIFSYVVALSLYTQLILPVIKFIKEYNMDSIAFRKTHDLKFSIEKVGKKSNSCQDYVIEKKLQRIIKKY